MVTRVLSWSDVTSEEVFPGIHRQAVVTESATIVRYIYEPGCTFPTHSHPEEQVTIVHSGKIEFTVGEQVVELEAGQVAVIPGGTPHGARVTGTEVVVTDNYIASASRTPLQFDED